MGRHAALAAPFRRIRDTRLQVCPDPAVGSHPAGRRSGPAGRIANRRARTAGDPDAAADLPARRRGRRRERDRPAAGRGGTAADRRRSRGADAGGSAAAGRSGRSSCRRGGRRQWPHEFPLAPSAQSDPPPGAAGRRRGSHSGVGADRLLGCGGRPLCPGCQTDQHQLHATCT